MRNDALMAIMMLPMVAACAEGEPVDAAKAEDIETAVNQAVEEARRQESASDDENASPSDR